jgi:hypothetical protein
VIAFGIWMVIDSEAWDFGQGLVQLALGLFAVAFVVGAAFRSRAALGAQRAAAAGDVTAAARLLRRWARGIRLILALLLVATWHMVASPARDGDLAAEVPRPAQSPNGICGSTRATRRTAVPAVRADEFRGPGPSEGKRSNRGGRHA